MVYIQRIQGGAGVHETARYSTDHLSTGKKEDLHIVIWHVQSEHDSYGIHWAHRDSQ